MNIVIGPLEAFYIAGGLLALAIAIMVLPTMIYGPKKTSRAR